MWPYHIINNFFPFDMFRLLAGWLVVWLAYRNVYGYNRASPIFSCFIILRFSYVDWVWFHAVFTTNHRKWASRIIDWSRSKCLWIFLLCACVSHSFIRSFVDSFGPSKLSIYAFMSLFTSYFLVSVCTVCPSHICCAL